MIKKTSSNQPCGRDSERVRFLSPSVYIMANKIVFQVKATYKTIFYSFIWSVIIKRWIKVVTFY